MKNIVMVALFWVITVLTVSGQLCRIDVIPPTIVGCPDDTTILLPLGAGCDTTAFWVQPTVEDNCGIEDFTDFMDISFWMIGNSGPGMGSNGTVDQTGLPGELVLTGHSDGLPGQESNLDVCLTFPVAGRLKFDFDAIAMGGMPQLFGDEPAVSRGMAEGILVTGPNCCVYDAQVSYDLAAGTNFCFRVKSDGLDDVTSFYIRNLSFQTPTIQQVSGPMSDSAPGAGDGTSLAPGTHTVVYEAEDYAGNTTTCSFDITVAASEELLCKHINVSLDEACGVKVIPQMVLAGQYPCYDEFDVVLYDNNGIIGDSVDLSHLGRTIDYRVEDPSTGNSCWGRILVEDKFIPEIICSNDTMNCMEFRFSIEDPEVIEHCQSYDIRILNELITNMDCDPMFQKFITRTYVAEDASGNVSDTCSQTVWIERFPFDRLMGPEEQLTLYCGSGFDTDAEGHPHPDVTGSPFLYNTYPANGELYGADNRGNYFKINLDNGQAELITGSFNDPPALPCPPAPPIPTSGVTEMEFDPYTGMAYGKSVDGCDYGFFFDPYTGEIEIVNTTTTPPHGTFFGDFQGAEVIDGVWYVSSVTRNTLDIFDPSTGTFSLVGAHGGPVSFNGLAWDGNTLYGCEAAGGTGLYSINIASGAASFIGDMGVNLGSIEIGPDGNIYGGGGMPPYRGNIYRIDPDNGSATLLGPTGLGTTITALSLVNQRMPLYPQPDFFCNMSVEYNDIRMPNIGCVERYLRTWEITEWWCRQDSDRVFQQMITVVDTVGPVVDLPDDTLYAKAGQRSCDALMNMPVANIYDACHSIERVDMVYPGGFSGGQNGGYITLPIGLNEVIYRVFDSCYNVTTDTVLVMVEDRVAPVAICEQDIVVALDNDGLVTVGAATFDGGSFDECEIDRFEVRRMTAPHCGLGTEDWGPDVAFCCSDLGADVMVGFRVVDKSGNTGACMVMVTVQDKEAPRVVALPDIQIDCRFDWTTSNTDVFGKFVLADSLRDSIILDADFVHFFGDPLDGVIYDNCPPIIEMELDTSNIDNCGLGYLIREFTFTDLQGNSSTSEQHIYFINSNPFDSTDITWPEHIDTMNVCGVDNFHPNNLPERYAVPRFTNDDECSLVGYDFDDQVIDASQGSEACFKILRHWTVIDWCQKSRGIHKRWTYTQVIEVMNDIAPVINSACNDTLVCYYNNGCIADSVTLVASATDDCTDSTQLFWRYKIDLGNDGDFEIVEQGNDASGVYPMDTHRIKFLVEDLCGNLDSCEFLFELRNCKGPTAYCRNGLIAELTPYDTSGNGMFDVEVDTVWASDFDENSGHVCGHPVALSFSADVNDTMRIYTCDSLVPPTRDVTIWVTDLVTGETSRCQTFVNVQDNNGVSVCPNTLTGTVSGQLVTKDDRKVENVSVELSNSGLANVMTDLDGSYAFGHMPFGGIYTVTPTKDGDDLNGVSTADIVAIQRHLLGKNELNHPHLMIAADVNNSGSVSAADIAELRRLILGVYSEFPDNTSWRFVDATHQFQDPGDPWKDTWPESYRIEPFVSDMDVDFQSIKVGDITGDVRVNGLETGNETRSQILFSTNDQKFDEGQLVKVALTQDEIEALSSFQFTLEWNTEALEYIGLVPNTGMDIDYENFGEHMVEEGALTASWHTVSKWFLPQRADRSLMTLEFIALESGSLRDNLQISSRITRNEATRHGSYEAFDVGLRFDKDQSSSFFALHQNVPNPWTNETIIGFTLPDQGEVRLSFFSENGSLIKEVKGRFDAGYSEMTFKRDDFANSGMVLYRLETQDHVAVKRMILTK